MHTRATDKASLQQARHTEQVQRKHPDTGSAGGFLLPEGKAGRDTCVTGAHDSDSKATVISE